MMRRWFRGRPGRTGPVSRLSLRDLLTEAWQGVCRRPLRSALTCLGTVLGVGAFVSTLGLAATAAGQVSSRFDVYQATQIRVQEAQSTAGQGFPGDAEARLDRLNGVRAAGRLWSLKDYSLISRLPPGPDTTESISSTQPVFGASADLLVAAGAVLSSGRTFDAASAGRPVALLGSAAAERLGVRSVQNGTAVYLDGKPVTVIGIIKDAPRVPELLLGVVLPIETAGKLHPDDTTAQQIVVSTRPGAAALIGQQAPYALRPDDPQAVDAVVPPSPERLRGAVSGDLNGLMLLLAATSLVVGALGIANTTLVSVMERTSEIGVRRAIGAQRRHIAFQFLSESTLLGLVGGLLGTCCAVLVVVGVSVSKDWTALLDPWIVVVAPLCGAATGLVAGFYPAVRAAAIPPVQALVR